MSTQGGRIVQTGALPSQTVPPLEAGSSNVFQSAAMKSTNQANLQTTLAQNGGIKRRKKHMRGGANGVSTNAAPVVVVTGASSYDSTPAATNANNTALAGLANTVSSQAALDGTVGGTQASAAKISAEQQAVYNGTGGSYSKKIRRNSKKKGGSFPAWQCLSGGKKSRRHKKSCKCKRRKAHKHTKRHRH